MFSDNIVLTCVPAKLDYGGCRKGIFSAACLVEALYTLENGLMKQSLNLLMQENLNMTGRMCLDRLMHEFMGWGCHHYL
jgi:hypothetical protein